MNGLQILNSLKTFLRSPQNKPKIFYFLAFVPFVAIVYLHRRYWLAYVIVPLYGFLLLAIKKHKLFSYREAKLIQKLFGFLMIVASPFVHLALSPLFPWTVYYGALNYAIHILGLFLVFFDIAAIKEALGPIVMILGPSAGATLSGLAESYFRPLVPSFVNLIVTILNVIGIKANVHSSISNWVVLYTPQGPATYEIIWACMGFESAFLFATVLIILFFEEPGSRKTKILWSAMGLLVMFILNIFRVVLIFVTEYFYTAKVSGTVHYFAGYVLFLTWITIFLYLYSKKERILKGLKSWSRQRVAEPDQTSPPQ